MTPLLQTKQGPNSIAPRIQLKENRIARSMPRIPIPYTFKEALRIDGAQKRNTQLLAWERSGLSPRRDR